MERAAEEQREERKRAAEEARLARIAELEKEKGALQAEIPTIKGLFSASKIKKLQARVDEIEIELTKLKKIKLRPKDKRPSACFISHCGALLSIYAACCTYPQHTLTQKTTPGRTARESLQIVEKPTLLRKNNRAAGEFEG